METSSQALLRVEQRCKLGRKQLDIDEVLIMGKQAAVDCETAEDRVGEFDVISEFEEISLEKSRDA